MTIVILTITLLKCKVKYDCYNETSDNGKPDMIIVTMINIITKITAYMMMILIMTIKYWQ